MFLDATYCTVRIGGRVFSQAIVIATGVSIDGCREILGHHGGDSEPGIFWTEFLCTGRTGGGALLRRAPPGKDVAAQ